MKRLFYHRIGELSERLTRSLKNHHLPDEQTPVEATSQPLLPGNGFNRCSRMKEEAIRVAGEPEKAIREGPQQFECPTIYWKDNAVKLPGPRR
jgi:hypothetical protein